MTHDDIAQAQAQLHATMETLFPDRHRPDADFPFHHDGRFWYSASHSAADDGTVTRHINEFGTVANGLRPPAIVEINVADRGRNNQIGGFFARDVADGTVYLMHSGSLNPGGYAFRDWLGPERLPAFDGSHEPRFGYVVLAVNTPTSGRSLVWYLERVEAYRRGLTNGEPRVQGRGFRPYFEEPRGWRVAHGPGVVEYRSRHGEVVHALQRWREKQPMSPGCRIVKDEFIDLGVANARDSLLELYEVKTSSARSDIYSAIGQLMIHSPARCRRIMVFPGDPPLPSEVGAALRRLEIDVLKFKLDDERAYID
ncbi:MAG: hypothetical protein OXN89_04325 [Bryobacterales bacterium]|nr:hypothetical protein [Bryobacterales bacterium]